MGWMAARKQVGMRERTQRPSRMAAPSQASTRACWRMWRFSDDYSSERGAALCSPAISSMNLALAGELSCEPLSHLVRVGPPLVTHTWLLRSLRVLLIAMIPVPALGSDEIMSML